jgi:hypothetical protein
VHPARRARCIGVVDLSAADADPGEDDLAGRGQRHRCQVLVEDLDVHVVDRATQWNLVQIGDPSITSWLMSSEVSVSP